MTLSGSWLSECSCVRGCDHDGCNGCDEYGEAEEGMAPGTAAGGRDDPGELIALARRRRAT
jgi:hypothetical protein